MSEFPNTPEGRKAAAEAGLAWSGNQASLIKVPDKKTAEKIKESFMEMTEFGITAADKFIKLAKGLQLAAPGMEIFNAFLNAWIGYFQGLVDWQKVVDIFQTLYETSKPLAEILAQGVNLALEEFNGLLEDTTPLLNDASEGLRQLNAGLEELGIKLEYISKLPIFGIGGMMLGQAGRGSSSGAGYPGLGATVGMAVGGPVGSIVGGMIDEHFRG